MSKARHVYYPTINGDDGGWDARFNRLVSRITKGKRYRRYNLYTVEFTQAGDFTLAHVIMSHPKVDHMITGTGFTKRSPRDPYSEVVGKTVALARAIRDALDIPLPKV